MVTIIVSTGSMGESSIIAEALLSALEKTSMMTEDLSFVIGEDLLGLPEFLHLCAELILVAYTAYIDEPLTAQRQPIGNRLLAPKPHIYGMCMDWRPQPLKCTH